MSTLMSVPDEQSRIFSDEKWKTRGLRGKEWMQRCLFPAKVGIFFFISKRLKYLSLFLPRLGVWKIRFLYKEEE